MPGEQAFLLAGIFILLSVAGWSIRYLWDRDRPQDSQQYLNVEYLKGLNFLLNEQTDQAVDLFLRMVRVDDETIETHFALGSLFRRRGEVDRAIRIHQNIIARPNLATGQRSQAIAALAKDYQKAGLLDRAEKLFLELVEDPEHKRHGLTALVQIYEQERDWAKAIDAGVELERQAGSASSLAVAHYHCELAEQAIADQSLPAARKYLREAQNGRSRTTRGTLIRAELAEHSDDEALAVKLYWDAVESNADLVVEVLPRLYRMREKTGQADRLESELEALAGRRPEMRQALAYTAILHPELQSKLLDDCVREYISSQPTLADFIDVAGTDDVMPEATFRRVRAGLSKLAQSTAKYRCSECGFSSMNLIWQCPSCKNWETQKPANEVRFDTLVRGGTVDW